MSVEQNSSVLAQIRRLEGGIESAAVSKPGAAGAADFGALLAQALTNVNQTQLDSAQAKAAYTLGEGGNTLADVMVVQQKARITFEATLRVRNHLVSAYQDIMNMPI